MKTIKILIMLCLIAMGVGVGFMISNYQRHFCDTKYGFINSRIACEGQYKIQKIGYRSTQLALQKFVEEEKLLGNITRASIYFRDLNDGPVFGVNELDDFIPASLLKLPVALSFMNEAETNPEILTTKIIFQGKQSTQGVLQDYQPSEYLEIGKEYTIKEMLRYMLEYSDNAAYDALEQYQFANKPGKLESTYLELGITTPQNYSDQIMSARRYSSLFRILYNSSYLNTTFSEMVLSWLAESKFDQGLVAGLPKDLVVAHKFGERITQDGVRQLHDCGIIYYPDNPYLLCVMTEGKNFKELTVVIETVSRTVYNALEAGSK